MYTAPKYLQCHIMDYFRRLRFHGHTIVKIEKNFFPRQEREFHEKMPSLRHVQGTGRPHWTSDPSSPVGSGECVQPQMWQLTTPP